MQASFRSLKGLLAMTLALALPVWLIGCGGGVDSGGTGSPLASTASGPITGFGSVIVNGVHYDDRGATVSDADGTSHSRDDLKLGMTTEIHGGGVALDANGVPAATATTIEYASAIVGPVSSIDIATKSLVVLGQTVRIDATTVFDDTLVGGLAALANGNVLEVYALIDPPTGAYLATRIERKAAPVTAFALRAQLGNLNSTARTFTLGGLAVSYAALGAGAVPATLANGQFVRVQLQTAPIAGVWQATRLRAASLQLRDGNETRIEGVVTAFTSGTQFSVDGVAVNASAASFPNGTAGVVLGASVRVQGESTAQVLAATRVEIRSSGGGDDASEFEIDGNITSVDPASQRFVVRGVTVDYSGNVEFRDGTAADLVVGRRVEVRGALSTDGTRLGATRIRLH